MTSRIYQGDALEVLRTLPSESVHCVVTSPPYWGLRDYGVAGQLGLEECVDCGWHGTPAAFRSVLATQGVGPCGSCFVCHMVAVFSEVRRVLRSDGTLWLNMGDGYAGSWGAQGRQGKTGILAGRNACSARQIAAAAKRTTGTGRLDRTGLKPKDMIGQPWRLALALQASGWWLRSEIIWSKPTCMPESIQDRPTKAHETIFLLAKAQAYYYDATAIREPVTGGARPRGSGVNRKAQKVPDGWDTAERAHGAIHREGRGAPQYRPRQNPSFSAAVHGLVEMRNKRTVWTIPAGRFPGAHFATFPEDLPAICIKAGCPRDGIVLDPFSGAGTTGLVARRLGRQFVGIELSSKYCRMARNRIERETSLFGPVEIVQVGTTQQEQAS